MGDVWWIVVPRRFTDEGNAALAIWTACNAVMAAQDFGWSCYLYDGLYQVLAIVHGAHFWTMTEMRAYHDV